MCECRKERVQSNPFRQNVQLAQQFTTLPRLPPPTDTKRLLRLIADHRHGLYNRIHKNCIVHTFSKSIKWKFIICKTRNTECTHCGMVVFHEQCEQPVSRQSPGSATPWQLAFTGESDPTYPWEDPM